ncbi:hypothetical protein N878_27750 [Pseudomonas sp. EGD-AK9]|nr:hypothetical protein N878_27750 [Pseudomonas sp. EGD-AK9]
MTVYPFSCNTGIEQFLNHVFFSLLNRHIIHNFSQP